MKRKVKRDKLMLRMSFYVYLRIKSGLISFRYSHVYFTHTLIQTDDLLNYFIRL